MEEVVTGSSDELHGTVSSAREIIPNIVAVKLGANLRFSFTDT
jgi:hypothetical protein